MVQVFRVFHPAIYLHLVCSHRTPEDVLDFPCAGDIPLNAASNDTKEFIEKVCFPFHFWGKHVAMVIHGAKSDDLRFLKMLGQYSYCPHIALGQYEHCLTTVVL